MDNAAKHAVGAAWGKLCDELSRVEDELHRREQSTGTSHDVGKMNRLRQKAASLTRRLERAERLMES